MALKRLKRFIMYLVLSIATVCGMWLVFVTIANYPMAVAIAYAVGFIYFLWWMTGW